jgi:hypothetical protein
MAGHELQAVPLHDHRDNKFHLGHPQSSTQANAMAYTERVVGELRTFGAPLGSEPLRFKPFWIVPVSWKPMGCVRADDHLRSSWNPVASDQIILDSRA